MILLDFSTLAKTSSEYVIRRKWEITFIIAILLVYLAAVYFSYGVTTIDDTYISLRYADNLVKYGQLSYNPGEAPQEGYTNFLLVLIEAVFIKLGIASGEIIPKMVGVVSGILTIIIVYLVSEKVSEPDNFYAKYVSATLAATSVPLIIWSTGGLETLLFTCLVLAGVWAFLASLKQSNEKMALFSDMFFFFAVLCRPEGLLFWILSYIYLVVDKRFTVLKTRIKSIAIFFGSFIAYILWKIFYFGDVLPLTFYAKSNPVNAEQIISGLIKFGYFLVKVNFNIVYFLLILTVLFSGLLRRQAAFRYMFLLWTAYVCYVITLGGFVVMDYSFRMYVPVIPLFYIMGSNSLGYFLNKFSDRPKFNYSVVVTIIVMQIAAGFYGLNTAIKYDRDFFIYERQASYTESHAEFNKIFVNLGLWLKEAMPPESTIVMGDVGAVPYYSELKVIDLWSLVTKEIVMLKRQRDKFVPGTAQYEAINAKIREYVFSKNPEVFIQPWGYGITEDQRFLKNYKIIAKGEYEKDNVIWVIVRKDVMNKMFLPSSEPFK